MEKIILKLDKAHYPQLLTRYTLKELKKKAINMALAQYKERPITRVMLYSCLNFLESDLEEMFPQSKTPEQIAKDKVEAAEEEAMYQEAIAEMEPYMVNGKQLLVDENGKESQEEACYPVWEDKKGNLKARIYHEGWDWIYPPKPEENEEND
jgi:arsenate reductase-like glutaredoxin family protein